MKGLRVGFIKSMGIEPVKGDGFINDMCICDEFNPFNAEHRESMLRNDTVITSFAPRKNTGEQPCGDDVPVVVKLEDVRRDVYKLASEFYWQHDECGMEWKPDLEALITMQAEHDAKQVDHFITGISEKETKESIIRMANSIKPKQLVYTPEIALTHSKPEPDMLCRVEHKYCLSDDISVDTVTFKFEADNEFCCIDKDGCVLPIDKEWFIAFHPISSKTELEIAQEKQINKLLPMIDFIGGDTELNRARLVKLQENGELSEIVLPLEK